MVSLGLLEKRVIVALQFRVIKVRMDFLAHVDQQVIKETRDLEVHQVTVQVAHLVLKDPLATKGLLVPKVYLASKETRVMHVVLVNLLLEAPKVNLACLD